MKNMKMLRLIRRDTSKVTRTIAHTLQCQPIQTADLVRIVISDYIYYATPFRIKLQIRLAQ